MPQDPQGNCPNYRPGHHMHWIHAGHVNRTPWGWRPGVVAEVRDRVIRVDYLLEDGNVALWHHEPLSLEIGAPVRVHEEYHALDIGRSWVNVVVRGGGLGKVPAPEVPEAWIGDSTTVVVNIATGRAETAP